jgi:VCBS repeat-containing protein
MELRSTDVRLNAPRSDASSGEVPSFTPVQVVQTNAALPASGPVIKIKPNAAGIVTLPDGSKIATIQTSAGDLRIVLDDGRVFVVEGAVSSLPSIQIGTQVFPGQSLSAAFGPIEEVQPAAGDTSPPSGGENFTPLIVQIDPAYDLSPLLPPTDLNFPQFERRDLGVLDDTPTVGEQTQVDLDEDFVTGVHGVGNQDADSTAGDDGGIQTYSGNLVYTFGANGPNAVEPIVFHASLLNGLGLQSHGVDVVFSWDQATLTLTAMAGDHLVLQLVVTDVMTGAFTVTLYGPLDNLPPGSGAFENNILLNLPFTVIDGNGTAKSGFLPIMVDDDAPMADGEQVSLTVNEDDILTLWSQGTSPNDGSADGSETEGVFGPAISTSSGQLSAVVSFGADGPAPAAFSFVDNAAEIMANAYTLYSKQSASPENGKVLTYEVVGNVLTAYEPAPNGNPVFSLTLETNGDFTFRLFDELIHQAGNGENTTLRNGDGFVEYIDFGQIIKATDFDGDSVLLTGKVRVYITDDVPEAHVIALRHVDLVHDETPGLLNRISQFDEAVYAIFPGDAQAAFDSIANKGDDPHVAGSGAIGYARTLLPVVLDVSNIGADFPPYPHQFALEIEGGSGVLTTLTLTDGTAIYLVQDPSDPSMIIGRAGAIDGPAAFAVHIDDDGRLSLVQYLSLQHPDTTNLDEPISLDGFVNVVLTVTDSDGDSDSDSVAIGSKIVFEDDGPTLIAALRVLGDVRHDETGGNQAVPNDDTTPTAEILAVFAGVNGGDDPHVDPQSGPIGYARSGSLVNVIVANFGADGPGAVNNGIQYTFSIGDSNFSGLQTTEGKDIFLFDGGNNVVVGRYDSDNSGTVTDTDLAAFAVHVNPDNGELWVVQYVSLRHPDTNNHDETIDLNDGALAVTVTLTDGDGDSISQNIDISGRVRFDDDGPAVTESVVTLTVNEDDILTLWSQGTSPNDGNADGSETEGVFGPAISTSTGQLSALVNFGADGPASQGTFSFVSNAAALMADAYSLYSKQTASPENGKVLTFDLVGNVLTAYEPAPNGNPVFSLTLETNGDFTFRLFDELIHQAGNGENTTLRNGDGFVEYIDFGQIITATDGDGDSVLLTGKVRVYVTDDVPEARIVAVPHINLVHDETPGLLNTVGQFDEAFYAIFPGDAQAAFDSIDNKGDDPHVTGSGAIGYARTLLPVVLDVSIIGADAPPYPHDFSLEIVGGDGTDSGLKLTDGTAVFLYRDATQPGLIIGRAGGESGPAAFAIHIDDNGSLSLVQYLSLQHPDTTSPDEPISLDGLVNAVLTVTDSDGDSDSDSVAIGSKIIFEDDGPTLLAALRLLPDVRHDETPGNQGGFLQPDDDTNPTAEILAIFSGVNGGDDPHVPPVSGPIGYARSGSLINVLIADFGADGPGVQNNGIQYTFAIGDSNYSGLQTTEGRDIFLFDAGNNVVIGRYDSDNSGTVTDTDLAAFAFHVNPDNGELWVVQYVSLRHPNTSSHDETIDLNDGALSVTVTLTDGDGDTVSQTIDISGRVRFDDDGPSVDVSAITANPVITALNLDETRDPDDPSDFTDGDDRYNVGETPDSNGDLDDTGTGFPIVPSTAPAASAAIGILTTSVSGGLNALFNTSINYGADGPSTARTGSESDQLSLSLSGNTKTNLVVTALDNTPLEGMSIQERQISLLVQDATTILGVINGGAGTGNDYIAFRITILNPTDPANAQIRIEQFLAIDHDATGNSGAGVQEAAENPSLYDETKILSMIGNGQIRLSLTTTVTDGDGDTATDSASVVLANSAGSFIQFDDDGPVVEALDAKVCGQLQEYGVGSSGGGNATAVALDGDGDRDILITAIGTNNNTVNGDANDLGAGNQQIDPTELLRIDFVRTAQVFGSGPGATYSNGVHYGVDSASFNIAQIQGNPNNTATVFVQVFNANDDQNYGNDGNPLAITAADISVANDSDGIYTLTAVYSGATIVGFVISGLDDGARVTVNTVSEFNRLNVENYSGITFASDANGTQTTLGGSEFSIGGISSTLCLPITLRVTHDESAGFTPQSGPNPENDVDPATAPVGLTTAITGAGIATVLGYAQSQGQYTASSLFSSPDFGTDGPASNNAVQYLLTNASGNGFSGLDSGLNTTVGDYNILLYTDATNPAIVWGVADDGNGADGAKVFALYIDPATGQLWVAQFGAIAHNSDGATAAHHDDIVSLAADAIFVSVVVTDGDGDKAYAVSAAGIEVNFQDDGPRVGVEARGETNILLTTQDAETIGNLSDTATTAADFGSVFASSAIFGTDGPGSSSMTFALSLTVASGSYSGLNSNGVQINLYNVNGVIVGATSAPVTATDPSVVFSIAVSSSGVVTLTQHAEIDHALPGVTSAPYDTQLATLGDGLVRLTATAQVVDGDGDTASGSAYIDLGGNIQFADDGPSISVTGSVPALFVDETNLLADATASFASMFTSSFGADGPGTISYTLGVNAGPTGLVDTASNEQVVLTLEAGAVYGRTAVGGDIVFVISVAANGDVTLDQRRAVMHDVDGPDPLTDHDDPKGLLTANLVTLTATIVDGDGDSASALADIGNAFVFEDDGPSITVTGSASLVVDETNLLADATASFAAVFTTAFGADGAGTIVYELGINPGSTGLVDTATGEAVVLTLELGIVVGRTETGGDIVFTLGVNASGVVTLDQQRAVMHDQDGPTPSDHDDPATLAAANLITLKATITDKDGDFASATADIASSLTFKDDGPAVTVTGVMPPLVVDETDLSVNASANFAAVFTPVYGADGQGAPISFALNFNPGSTGLVDTATGQTVVLSLESGSVVGRTSVSNETVFVISVNAATGEVSLDQQRAVMHDVDGPDPVLDHDDPSTLAAANLITLTATVTDGDGDTASASVDIGNTFTFKDDGPSVAAVDAKICGQVQTYASSGSGGGNVTGLALDGAGDRDLLVTAVGSNNNTVNGDADDLGSGNQWVDPVPELLRVDFVRTAQSFGSGPGSTYSNGAHYGVDSASFTIAQTRGGTATVFVSVYSANDDQNYANDGAPLAITAADISVANDPTFTLTAVYSGANIIGYVISGLAVGARVTVNTTDEFNRLNIENYSGVSFASNANGATTTINGGDFSVGTISSTLCLPVTLRVTHDESAGFTPQSGPNPENDVNPATAPAGLTAAITGAGIVTVLGYAQSQDAYSAATLFSSPDFGADGPATTNPVQYLLTAANGAGFSGLDSTLNTTVGNYNILLYTDATNPAILWGVADTGAGANGPKVFALYIDPATGQLWVAQFGAIAHNSDGSTAAQHDDFVSIVANAIFVSVVVTDGDGDTAYAVSENGIEVNFQDSGPIAVNDTVSTDEDQPITFSVTGNDNFGTDGPAVLGSVAIATSPTHGGLVLNPDNTFTYTPNSNYNGPDSFTYRIYDGDGDFTTATVNITVVSVPDAPTAYNDAGSVTEAGVAPPASPYFGLVNTPVNGTPSASGNVLSNDSDPDGPIVPGTTHTVVAVGYGSVGVTFEGVYGQITINTNGTWTYNLLNLDPDTQALLQAQGVTETFSYTMQDTNGLQSTANLVVNVSGTNDAPVIDHTADTDYTTGDPAEAIMPDLSIDDVDSPTLNGAQVVLTNAQAGDLLNYTGALPVGVTATTTSGAGTITLTFLGSATLADYEALLQTVTFATSSVISSTVTRNFDFQVIDNHNAVSNIETEQMAIELGVRPLVVSGFTQTVEEEHLAPALGAVAGETITAIGNEDFVSNPDLDLDDTGQFDNTTHHVTGSFLSLIASGIDGTLTFGFDATVVGTQATFGGSPMTSGGQPVIYAIQGNTLYGYVEVTGASFNVADDRAVFALEVDSANGDYTFSLLDKVDHHAAIDADNDEGVKQLDLSGVVTVTDSAEPETAEFPDVYINIIDDVPVLVTGSASTSLGEPDQIAQTATANISALISFGADGAAANSGFSVALAPVQAFGTLTANGQQIYVVSDGTTLTGFLEDGAGGVNGALNGDDTTVFTVTVSPAGVVTLSLLDQLDHNGQASLALAFGNFIRATDGDGDFVTFGANAVVFNVADSSPAANTISLVADEDDLLVANGALFDGNNNTNDIGDDAQSNLTGSLGSYGFDGQGDVDFAGMTGNVIDVNTLAAVQTDGVTLQYFWDAATHTLYGSTDATDATTAANTASFKIVVDPVTLNYTFTLIRHLDHPAGNNENDIDIALGFTIADSDTSTATGTINVKIDDDMPLETSLTTGLPLDEDDLPEGSDSVKDPLTANGNLTHFFGADGGSTTLSADGATWNAGTQTLTGANDAWTIVLNGDGTYTFTLLDNVAHDTGNGENNFDIQVSYSSTDGDGDTISGGFYVRIVDDVASVEVNVTGEANILLTTQDAQTIGANSDTDVSTADFSGVFSTVLEFGADGPGTSSASYALSLDVASGTFSGLTSNGVQINLYDLGGVIVGATSAPVTVADPSVVFSISVATDGVVTLTQHAEIDHADQNTTAAPYDTQFATLADGLVRLTASADISDADGDTDADSKFIDLGGNIRFADDGPSISATAAAPSLVADETDLDTNPTGDFSTVFTSSYGADGPGTIAYTLGAIAGPSGLVDVATGDDVVLSVSGNQVLGKNSLGDTVFVISVDAAGVVTLDQQRAVEHLNDADPDDSTGLSAANLITLTATITDGDDDSASSTIEIGDAFTFKDDGPSITVGGTLDSITVDESALATDATGDFSQMFTSSYGADGAGTSVYGVSLVSTVSGLTDTATGLAVELSVSGNQIVGSAGPAGPVVFTFTIDTATGIGTLDQVRAVEHSLGGANHNDSTTLSSDAIRITKTVTDRDGDEVSDSIVIGTNLNFFDDGPNTLVTVGDDAAVVATTQDANTIGAAFDTATADFAAVFSVTQGFGADGAGTSSLTYSLSLQVAAGTDSTLDSNGLAVYLYDIGGVITGSTSATQLGVDATNTVFMIETTTGGLVTVKQYAELDHPAGGGTPYNNQTIALGTSLVRLNATATIEDGDGDTASSVGFVDLGGNIQFADDGPALNIGVFTNGFLTVDETSLGVSAMASFASIFVPAYGADGPGSVGNYVLGTPGGNSGLFDTATGQQVVLAMQGNDVVGTIDAGATEVFRISINAGNGDVTLHQTRAIAHDIDGSSVADHDDAKLLAANLVTLTATITDGDGDTFTTSTNVGQAFRFDDDGPSVTALNVPSPIATLDESFGAAIGDANAHLDDQVGSPLGRTSILSGTIAAMFAAALGGADGIASQSYALVLKNASGTAITDGTTAVATNLLTTSGSQAISLYFQGGEIVGRVGGPGGTVALKASINASTGEVTVEQYMAIKHPTTAHDESLTLSAGADGGLFVSTTVYDRDGDFATATSTVGITVNIEDDGPTITTVSDVLMANVAGQATGQVVFDAGTDAPHTFTLTALTSIPGVSYATVAQPDGGSLITATVGSSTFFTLDLNADGSYTFDLVTPRPTTTVTNALSNIAPGNYSGQLAVGSATFDGLLFNSTGPTNFTNPNNNTDTLNVSSGGFGVQNANLNDNEGFMFGQTGADSLTFNVVYPNGQTATNISWAAYNGPTPPTNASVPIQTGSFTLNDAGANGVETTTIDPSGTFNWLVVRFDHVGNFRVEAFSYSTAVVPDNQTFSFNVTLTDGDGDFVTGSGDTQQIDISLQGGGVGSAVTLTGTGDDEFLFGGPLADVLNGGGGNDTLLGGAGADNLTGGLGADTFKLTNATVADIIVDYDAAQGDVIDLSSLFTVGAGQSIDDYVALNGPNTALMYDANGPTGGVSHTTTLATFNGNVETTVNILYNNNGTVTQHTLT